MLMRIQWLAIMLAILLLVALVRPALAGPAVRCTTHHEQTLNRLQTLCSDGTRAVSTYKRTLDRVPELSGRGGAR